MSASNLSCNTSTRIQVSYYSSPHINLTELQPCQGAPNWGVGSLGLGPQWARLAEHSEQPLWTVLHSKRCWQWFDKFPYLYCTYVVKCIFKCQIKSFNIWVKYGLAQPGSNLGNCCIQTSLGITSNPKKGWIYHL